MAQSIVRSFMRLRDGRTLAYASTGLSDPVRPLVVHMHGWPSSCQEASLMSGPVTQGGFRLVCPDRPGVGGSSIDPNLSFRSVASDMEQLLDHLGATHGAIMMGASGGGPHACACAALLGPKRIRALALMASMTHTWGPGSTALMRGMDLFNRAGYNFVAYAPSWCLRWSVRAASLLATYVAIPLLEGILGVVPHGYKTSDSPVTLQQPPNRFFSALRMSLSLQLELAPMFLAALRDAFGGGHDGALGFYQDVQLTCAPWKEFSLSSITVPTAVFQGDQDTCVPLPMAQFLASSIPGAQRSRQASKEMVTGIQGSQQQQPLAALAADHETQLLQPEKQQVCSSRTHSSNKQEQQSSEPDARGLYVLPGEGHLSLVLRRLPDMLQIVRPSIRICSKPSILPISLPRVGAPHCSAPWHSVSGGAAGQ